MQNNCLDFYHQKGCCLNCKDRKQGCWCDICMCHDCYWYSKFKDQNGGICDHLRATIKTRTVDFDLEIVEGNFKLKYSKDRFLHLGNMRNGFFTTRRNESHYFIKYQGFGLNLLALEKLREMYPIQCNGIRIIYNGRLGEINYYSVPKDWFEKGEPHMNEIYPHDDQIILKTKLMEERICKKI